MASRLNPYISFSDNARQALEFYKDVFGGKLELSTFADLGQTDAGDLIMHGALETDQGFSLMGADTPPGMERREGSAISISLSGDDAELRDYFTKLSSGGTVTMPLEKQVWGDEFGMCVDQFGIAWMVNVSAGERAAAAE